jgi:phage head maturation protease
MGKVVGCHPTKAKAQAQLAALNINVHSLTSPPPSDAMSQSEVRMPETLPPRDDLVRARLGDYEVRTVEEGPDVLAGHFARFNEWTEIDSIFEGRFMEQIAPGSFVDSFARLTPKALFQHGRDPEIGDKFLGSPVSVREDDQGAAYEVPLFASVPPLILDGLRAGAYGASFRFSVEAEEVVRKPERSDHNPEALPERTITQANVMEFGPVTFPAYAGATAGLRSLTDVFRPDRERTIAEMARDHPQDLARIIEKALKVKGSEAEPPDNTPPPATPPRFRSREEYLQWLSKS